MWGEGRKPEYGLVGWVYKGGVVGALTEAEKNSIGLRVENYNLGLGDLNNPADIRPRNWKKNLGTRGLNYFQISITFSYIFPFPSLPSFVHPLPISSLSPTRLSPCYKSIWHRIPPPLSISNWETRKYFGGSGRNKPHTKYQSLVLSRKGGRSKYHTSSHTQITINIHLQFIRLLFSCWGV